MNAPISEANMENQQRLMEENPNFQFPQSGLEETRRVEMATRPATTAELTGMVLMLRSRGYAARFE